MKRLLVIAGLLLASLAQAASGIERIEPPSWWVGMANPRVQLMVHGPAIGSLQVRVRHPGVKLIGSHPGGSANYLFVDLEIARNTRPASITLEFLQQQRVVATWPYALQARAAGSAQRTGFGPRDAIYLIVPDRFANGDPSNDDVPGMGDPALRSDPNRRHGGDLAGLAARLDYIAGMGFTQIWPTPLVENRQPEYSYHGYSPTDLYRIDPRFGNNEQYRQVVEQARAKGVGMIQDIVLNHIGSGHWWMQDLPFADWINGAGQPYVETNHRHSAQQDPYVAAVDRERLTDGWFVPTMPDLNQRRPELATYLVQNAVWWIEYASLSGLRVDTYPYSDKTFLARWSAAVMAEYPRITLVGEEMTQSPLMVSYWLKGRRNRDGYVSSMPSMMDFPLFGSLREALVEPEDKGFGVGLGKLYEAMLNDLLYPEPERMVLFDGNHDTNRIFSALGEDAALTRMAFAVLATTRRTPQFFSGTEILMTSPIERDDGRLRADFPGGWAGDTTDAFSGRGLSPAQAHMQDWLRRLLTWRKTARAVHEGRLLHYAPMNGVYVYFRQLAASKTRPAAAVMVVLNKNPQAVELDMPRFREGLGDATRLRDVISGQTQPLAPSMRVPAREALVFDLLP